MRKRVKVILNERDSFCTERKFIEDKVLLYENNRYEFESDDDIKSFNDKTPCWTDREAYKFVFYNPIIIWL